MVPNLNRDTYRYNDSQIRRVEFGLASLKKVSKFFRILKFENGFLERLKTPLGKFQAAFVVSENIDNQGFNQNYEVLVFK
jgi:hypothetical protein